MSVFGVTNYLLVTQKGRTYIPFVRGTGFLVDYSTHSFHSKHVLTAAHVAAPLRFPSAFGNPPVFQRLGERHLTPKIILFSQATGQRRAILPLEFQVNVMRGTSVAALRIKGERELFERMQNDGVQGPAPFQLDDAQQPQQLPGAGSGIGGLDVADGEELLLRGLELERDEDGADTAEMKAVTILARARLSYISKSFGPAVIVSTGKKKVTGGMSGCPVIRKSNGKCVGVLVAPVKTHDDPDKKHGGAGAAASSATAGSRSEAVSEEEGAPRRASIFNEERLPRRANDDAAMQLAVQEFELAHRNMEPPALDLVGQEETLDELFMLLGNQEEPDQAEGKGASSLRRPQNEHFAAFVPLREFLGPLRFSENA